MRAPNLLTVPGDIVAGFLLAPAVAAVASPVRALSGAILAGLCFYAAGILLNDVFDFAEDARDRPSRPLPSGAVRRETAAAIALVLLGVGGVCAAFAKVLSVALPLIVLILLYDGGLKRNRWLGPLAMGLCRSLNLWMGAAAATGVGGLETVGPAARLPMVATAILGIYIAGVTALARNEAAPNARVKPRHIAFLLGLLLPLQGALGLCAIHRWPWNLTALLFPALWPLLRRWTRRIPSS